MPTGSRRCLVNPESGTADHAERVAEAMEERGFDVVETDSVEHTVELAEEAGEEGVSALAVCGGDGTINDALRGLWRVNALGDVTFVVLPAGTANLLAGNLGIESLEHGIELVDVGDVRSVDVGVATGSDFGDAVDAADGDDDLDAAGDGAEDTAEAGVESTEGGTDRTDGADAGTADPDHDDTDENPDDTPETVDEGVAEPFIVSCIAGLPAEASTGTSGELKERFGTLAFLLGGARETVAFDGLDVRIESPDRTWTGEALCVLVGNSRKFIEEGGQADMEDGMFDVVVVKQMPASGVAVEAAIHRLLGEETEGVTHFRTGELEVASDGEPITFSRDGEMATYDRLEFTCLPGALDVVVGEEYVPHPE